MILSKIFLGLWLTCSALIWALVLGSVRIPYTSMGKFASRSSMMRLIGLMYLSVIGLAICVYMHL